ncbi:MAG: TatD family hydrolase [Candidatus Nitricoxidivorans perseverans]|uniref:TatD family hydrolase n=1 Tax=Candidatus Nitricoxidivorans perseverans TaxID=2975601 RepID=A0AA49IYU3_9PROT|nr:MAG: TatD family hydrolase [Candidatus Nitricoxidivorans perseverans]
MLLVDSHCHPDFPELAQHLPQLIDKMHEYGVCAALCAGVTLERFPALMAITRQHPHLFAAVGVHPDTREGEGAEPDVETLVRLAEDPKVVAIGETGLDYYRLEEGDDAEWQRRRFRIHVGAARRTGNPLIIHMRSAAADTLAILKDEEAGAIGGVFHCFTEDMDTARRALDLGFYISFSGIVTFKNAQSLKEIVRWVPLDRLLIETDAPYLAPVPHRGKINEPAYVRHVAEEIARLRDISLEEVAKATTDNFFRLFRKAVRPHE